MPTSRMAHQRYPSRIEAQLVSLRSKPDQRAPDFGNHLLNTSFRSKGIIDDSHVDACRNIGAGHEVYVGLVPALPITAMNKHQQRATSLCTEVIQLLQWAVSVCQIKLRRNFTHQLLTGLNPGFPGCGVAGERLPQVVLAFAICCRTLYTRRCLAILAHH